MSLISSVDCQMKSISEECEKQEKALPAEEQLLFRQAIAPLLHQMRQEIAALKATGHSFTLIQGRVTAFAKRIQARKKSFFQERKIIYKAQAATRSDLTKEAADLSGCAVDFGGDSLASLITKVHKVEDRATSSYAASVLASLNEADEEPDAFDALSYTVGRAGLRAGMLTARVVAIPVHIADGAISFVTPAAIGDVCKAGFNKAVALVKEHAPDCVKDAYKDLRLMGDEIANRYDLPPEETAQFKKDAKALVTVGVIGTAVKVVKVAKGLKKSDTGVIEGTFREVAERTDGASATIKKLLDDPATYLADDFVVFSPLVPKPKIRSMAEKTYVSKIRAKAPLPQVAHSIIESCPEKLTTLKPDRAEDSFVESLERDLTTITYVNHEGFRKVGLTIGRAVSVVVNPSASIPAYKIHLDMGAGLTREHEGISHGKPHYTSSAQLCSNHKEEDLTGSLLLTVINFPRKQIGKMMSDCLVTGVQKEGVWLEEKRATTVYMTTSSAVDVGARVSILAEKEILETNPRDIIWTDFLNLDLRIGTIEGCESCVETAREINTVLLRLNMGAEKGSELCVGLLNKEYDLSTLVGRQVLVLTNLEATAKKELFGREELGPVLLTAGGGTAVLEPAKPVENGYKLA